MRFTYILCTYILIYYYFILFYIILLFTCLQIACKPSNIQGLSYKLCLFILVYLCLLFVYRHKKNRPFRRFVVYLCLPRCY